VLRPATPDALERLAHAARTTDRELDTALICLGILPPLDLVPIRDALLVPGVVLRGSANGDGHRVVEVTAGGRTIASIHHDGRVATHGQRPTVAA
jgi:hypothetical protein